MVAFDYKYLPVNELRVVTKEDQRTGKPIVDHVLVHDEPLKPSDRFWHSIFARFGFGKDVFKFFDHQEVLTRISERAKNDRLRVCVERREDGKQDLLLGVSNPNNPVVLHPELMDMVTRYEGQNITYAGGVVESMHVPRVINNFDVKGDLFSHRFVMSTPIDGYGQPNIYLSLLRQICSNGMIGYSRQFRSTLALGKGNDAVQHVIGRALDGFNSDEGFAVMRQRMEAATASWLSVGEALALKGLVTKMHGKGTLNADDPTLLNAPALHGWVGDGVQGSPFLRAFEKMTGDASHLYGFANLEALSLKKQRTLPVRCTVYDAMNYATEVATHYAKPEAARQLNAWVGGLISEEYDLENTKDRFSEFTDFHVERAGADYQLAT